MVDFPALADRFGIPIAGFVLFAFAIARGWLRSGLEVDKTQSLAEKEIAYREQLRAEERVRSDRLEATLATTVSALRDMTEVLKDVERELGRLEPPNRGAR